jgi:T-complex protein 1 subunit gamma
VKFSDQQWFFWNGNILFYFSNIHPITIIAGYKKALEDCLVILNKISKPGIIFFNFLVDISSESEMKELIKSSIGTKMTNVWSDMMCSLAYSAVRYVATNNGGKMEVDIKRYARIEKIPGGSVEDCLVLDGIMINKDVTHPKMRRMIKNPRIVLLDCPLEYKKGESQTNVEVSEESHWARLLEIEEEQVKELCDNIMQMKPDLVITEKGVSDIAQHFLMKSGITVIRRCKKQDNNRIARACGATIVNRTEELKESDVGTGCGLFEVRKIGDEYFTYLVECKDPKCNLLINSIACTIVLRGPSKDILQEIDRNLQDAM